jgi:NifU-like protein
MIAAKAIEYGKSPRRRGVYFLEEAAAKGLAFVTAKVDDMKIFWLVDPEEERIVNAKFFTYGGQDSTALGEALCNLSEGAPVKEAFAITGAKVISLLVDSNYFPFNNDALSAQADRLIKALQNDYPLAQAKLSVTTYKSSEKKREISLDDQKWLSLSKQDQLKMIEAALDGQAREALEMDGGGIEIMDIKDDWDVYAQFQGACSSCSASVGSTFIVVENIIKTKVHEKLHLVVNSFPW